MFRLDYLSCFLTILATVLVARKSWTGLLISIVNSVIVCIIGFQTSQFGFIPANLICICVYAFSIRSWLKKTHTHRIRNHPGCGGLVANILVMSPISPSRSITIGQEHLKLNSAARRSYDLLLVARNRERMDDLAKKLAADTRRKVEILAADLTNSNDLTGLERILRDDSRATLLVNNAGVGHHCAFTEFGCRRHEPDDHAHWRIDRGRQMSGVPYSTDGRGPLDDKV